jgi:hypothetical protein
MVNNTKILNLQSELKILSFENNRERYKMSIQFNTLISELISKTPSGELRNKLTELNILHNAITETII